VIPSGPACHTDKRSCFFNVVAGGGKDVAAGFLRQLEAVIADRKTNPAEGSYTSALFREGMDKISQKVGEESTETIVLLAARGVCLADVEAELERRHR
jgi:phosphoribosyl-ATP pyrophosphohydrolase/phosphoribosyl-AMP cyclohydrolase